MSLGVLGAIHWEALKIWLKGERLRKKPAPPARTMTVVRQEPLEVPKRYVAHRP